MSLFTTAPWLTLVTGHYGAGKTNFSLNAVRDLRTVVPRVTLIDLDIVNPYFRSTDNRAFVEAHDIELLGPVHGASNLDTPSLSPGIDTAIQNASMTEAEGHAVLIDVGGDPDGARALGRYSARIAARPHRVVYVANFSRPETATVAENSALLREIEGSSKLKVTEIVGNTHLKEFTTAENIAASVAPTLELARATGLSLRAITAPRALAAEVQALVQGVEIYPVDLIIGTPWEQ
jgi:hypothetical protein